MQSVIKKKSIDYYDNLNNFLENRTTSDDVLV